MIENISSLQHILMIINGAGKDISHIGLAT